MCHGGRGLLGPPCVPWLCSPLHELHSTTPFCADAPVLFFIVDIHCGLVIMGRHLVGR
jgi:hypothetical protein